MLVLSADTSLPLLSVALVRDGLVVGSLTLEGKSSRNEKLLPAIDFLLAESGVERTAIDLFAVTRGPGSFTGVRIGLATMQGLALALAKPLCAISTHEAIALGGAPTATRERTVVRDDAGRGELYVSVFEGETEISSPHLVTMDQWPSLVTPESRVLTIADFLQHGNVAVSCARRAESLAAGGDVSAHSDITPIYVRLAEAEVKLRQTNG